MDCNSPVQSIRSRSGHLEGTYSVSKSLQLHSNAGAIKANVKVLKLDEEIKVEASSDAGNVSLNYLEQAKGTKLNSSALSKAGKVQVQHAGNFVGNWKLKTDVGSANVDDQITDNDHRLKIDRVEKKITSVSCHLKLLGTKSTLSETTSLHHASFLLLPLSYFIFPL